MRILIVGKFPPVQGGVSAQTFWTATDLAARGHEVHVVTNACDNSSGRLVEYLFPNDMGLVSGNSRNLTVHTTTSIGQECYTPWAEPYVSKLLGLVLDVCAKARPDIIVGWYFEPYGLVAAQAAAILGIPFVVRHAGSDLGRLAKHPNLNSAYRWMLSSATAVITGRFASESHEQLIKLGAHRESLVPLYPCRLPSNFTQDIQTLDMLELQRSASSSNWWNQYGRAVFSIKLAHEVPISFSGPVIGVFGKLGETKGTYDLIGALSSLANSDCDFRLALLCSGRWDDIEQVSSIILNEPKLRARTILLPPLAPWRVPAFIASCDAIAYLERDFPISAHAPTLPREVIAVGTLLILSQEIVRKQPFRSSLVSGRNCIIIEDPRNIALLTEVIGSVIRDPANAKVIGRHGKLLSDTIEQFLVPSNSMSDAIEDLTEEILDIDTSEVSLR